MSILEEPDERQRRAAGAAASTVGRFASDAAPGPAQQVGPDERDAGIGRSDAASSGTSTSTGMRLGDSWAFTHWINEGYRHRARTSRNPFVKASNWVLFGVGTVVSPVILPVNSARLNWSGRTYVSPGRDALLHIGQDRKGLRIKEHAAAGPGTGTGRRLREEVLPDIAASADREGRFYAHAYASVAKHYLQQFPDLVDIGPTLDGKRVLVRAPEGRSIEEFPKPLWSRIRRR